MSVQSIFEEIESNLANLEIDEIKRRLDPIFIGMAVDVPIVDPGTFLYRARKIGGDFNKTGGITRADLIYPPKARAKMGRLNRPNESMFYCSIGKEALVCEVQGLKPGDELLISIWQTTEKMLLNNIGYTQYVFDKLGAKRQCPSWSAKGGPSGDHAVVSIPGSATEQMKLAIASDSNREIREILSEKFVCEVTDGDIEKYKLTVAIAELHLGSIIGHATQFAGLLYPSVRTAGNSDNLALLPWYVDQHLLFRKAVHIRIDSIDNMIFSVTNCDCAKDFDKVGRLIWLGRVLNWQLQPGQGAKFTFTAGRDDYGDYETAVNGELCHWVAVDHATGDILPAQ
jgi:hypothetical protein